MTTEQMREEFVGRFIMLYGSHPKTIETASETADWWLAKLSQDRQNLNKAIEGARLPEIDDSLNCDDDPNYEAITNRGHNSALDVVLKLLD